MRLDEGLELVVVEVEFFSLLLDLLVLIFFVSIGIHLLFHHGGVHASDKVAVHVILGLALHAGLVLDGGQLGLVHLSRGGLPRGSGLT